MNDETTDPQIARIEARAEAAKARVLAKRKANAEHSIALEGLRAHSRSAAKLANKGDKAALLEIDAMRCIVEGMVKP